MKSLTGLVITLTLLGGAVSVPAAPGDAGYLQVCTAELQDYFGADAEVKLVSRQRFADGQRLRVAARRDADNADFATCWVANGEVRGHEIARRQEDMVAAAEPVAPGQ